jgi:hypothetical protein
MPYICNIFDAKGIAMKRITYKEVAVLGDISLNTTINRF